MTNQQTIKCLSVDNVDNLSQHLILARLKRPPLEDVRERKLQTAWHLRGLFDNEEINIPKANFVEDPLFTIPRQ